VAVSFSLGYVTAMNSLAHKGLLCTASKMGDCFIRVSENNFTHISAVILTYNHFVCFDVLNGDMAVYLGKEIPTITNYIHAISGDTSGLSNFKIRFIIIILAPMIHIALC